MSVDWDSILDEDKIRILGSVINHEDKTHQELADELDVSEPTVTQKYKKLTEAGLLHKKGRGEYLPTAESVVLLNTVEENYSSAQPDELNNQIMDGFSFVFDDKNALNSFGRIGIESVPEPDESVFRKADSSNNHEYLNKALRYVDEKALDDLTEGQKTAFIGAIRGWKNDRIAEIGGYKNFRSAGTTKSQLAQKDMLIKEGKTKNVEYFIGPEAFYPNRGDQSEVSGEHEYGTDIEDDELNIDKLALYDGALEDLMEFRELSDENDFDLEVILETLASKIDDTGNFYYIPQFEDYQGENRSKSGMKRSSDSKNSDPETPSREREEVLSNAKKPSERFGIKKKDGNPNDDEADKDKNSLDDEYCSEEVEVYLEDGDIPLGVEVLEVAREIDDGYFIKGGYKAPEDYELDQGDFVVCKQTGNADPVPKVEVIASSPVRGRAETWVEEKLS